MSQNVSQFRDSRWQRKRLELLEAAQWTCESCGDTTHKELQVHHKYYEKGAAPWDYPTMAYEVLCDSCHQEVTKNHAMFQTEYKESATLAPATDLMLAGFCRIMSGNDGSCADMETPETYEVFWGMMAGLLILRPEGLRDLPEFLHDEIKNIISKINEVAP